MRKIPQTLYSANREMKSVLTRSTFGIALSKLKDDNDRISILKDADLLQLLDYLSETKTVTFFLRDEELHIISNEYVSQGYVPDITPVDHRTLEPVQAIILPLVKSLESKSVRPASYQNNREKPTVIDLDPYAGIIGQFPKEYYTVAIEVMDAIRRRRGGCTLSELTRHSDNFNMLSETGRNVLIDMVIRYNDDIRWVDGETVPSRAVGTMVLLHQSQATVATLGVTGSKELDVESPFKAQLGKLLGKLTLSKKSEPVKPNFTSHASAPVTRIVLEEPKRTENPRIAELMKMMESYSQTIRDAESTIRTANANLDSALHELKELLSNESN